MILFDLTIYTSKLLNANFNSPKLLSNGNIVLIRNRKRASLLCVSSSVLIYIDLRLNSEILNGPI